MARYLNRDLSPSVGRALDSMPVVVVTGMRQVGKTTLLRNDPALRNRQYLSLDDFTTSRAAETAPEALLDVAQPLTIDEVQKAPHLMDALKVAVDAARRPGRYLLSGSANLLLMNRVTETLAGRAVYLTLHPMTRRELLGSDSPPFLVSLLEEGRPSAAEASPPFRMAEVVRGGMPPVALDRADPAIWFQGFEQTYLERDIRALAQVGDLTTFQRFLRLTALRTGKLLNLSNLARDAGLAASTATRYLGLLETSFSILRVPPFLRNPTKRLVKASKIYVADAGLASHLVGDRSDPMSPSDPHSGALLETHVAVNLAGILGAWRPRSSLCFWNIQGRYEVDFVIEDGPRTVAIEVKAGSRWRAEDLRGLNRFLAAHPDCIAGLLACDIPELTPIGDRVWAVPLGQLLS